MPTDIARILIVDDDSENGKFLEQQLASEGSKAVWYKDPREALRQFRRGRYQVAIVDLRMPHMNGVELFHHFREKDPDIGIIILTGYPSVESALATLKKGAYDYVKKPYKIDELKKVINRLLEDKGFFLDLELLISQRIGKRVKEYRTQRQWTITRLAAQTQLSKSLISQLENAKNSASLATLSKIARSLKIRVGDLVKDL